MYYSMKIDIMYLGNTVSEIKTFRPESMSHTTRIGDNDIIITANDEFTGVTLETINEKENVAKCNIYLPFPEVDQIQEPFSFPNLFKLSLRTVKPVVKTVTKQVTPVLLPKTILLRDIVKNTEVSDSKVEKPFVRQSSKSHKDCPLLSLCEESRKKLVNFTCGIQQKDNKSTYLNCIQMFTANKTDSLCTKCKGKVADCAEYKCEYLDCKTSKFIENDGMPSGKYCTYHSKKDGQRAAAV